MLYEVEPLGKHHNRAAFTCGVAKLDWYLKQQASQDVKRGWANVFIMIEPGTPTIVGYYTLSSNRVDLTTLPPEAVPQGGYKELPVVLIGRLARDIRYKGKDIGSHLLASAIRRAVSGPSAAWTVIVDAKDDKATAFYEDHSFCRCLDDDHPSRLFLPRKTLTELLATT